MESYIFVLKGIYSFSYDSNSECTKCKDIFFIQCSIFESSHFVCVSLGQSTNKYLLWGIQINPLEMHISKWGQ